MRFLGWILLVSALALGTPGRSPIGLCSFDVPPYLPLATATKWGTPNLTVEYHEEYIRDEKQAKDFERLYAGLRAEHGKKLGESGAEVDGKDGKIITTYESGITAQSLFVRHGDYYLCWKVWGLGADEAKIADVAKFVRQSIRFDKANATLEFNREVRDPSGKLSLTLPSTFGGGGKRYSDGQVILTLTPLREGGEATQSQFAYNFTPDGFEPYLRRSHVEMGPHSVGLICSTSRDGRLESQMVMLTSDESSVVLSFMGPVNLRDKIKFLRETIVSKAQWAGKSSED